MPLMMSRRIYKGRTGTGVLARAFLSSLPYFTAYFRIFATTPHRHGSWRTYAHAKMQIKHAMVSYFLDLSLQKLHC